jgi:MFS family permease
VQTFHLAALSSALTFILAFGAVKAVTNFFAGTLSDRFGRKPVLVAGWLSRWTRRARPLGLMPDICWREDQDVR